MSKKSSNKTSPSSKMMKASKPSMSSLGTDIVEVFVGSDRKRFVLHKDVVSKRSDFFRGMFEGNFKEAEAGSCELCDEDPESFELVVHCLYTDAFPTSVNAINEKTGNTRTIESIFKFYLLADQFLLSDHVKTQATNQMLKILNYGGSTTPYRIKRALTSEEVNLGLGILPDNDAALYILMDLVCYCYVGNVVCPSDNGTDCKLRCDEKETTCRDAWLEKALSDIPPSRIVRLMATLVNSTKGSSTWNNSSPIAKAMNTARIDGIEQVDRYKVGYLRDPEKGGPRKKFKVMASADDDDGEEA